MSSGPTLDLSGVYPPIATPFDEDENIDYGKLQFNMSKWNEAPFRGYVVQGSNGEYSYLNYDERVEMVAAVRKMAPKDKLVMAGSGCESTRDTIVLTKKMADAGAVAVMVVTPCYYKGRMTNSAMEHHYTKVADESPVPIVLYSVPANTGIDLSPEVVVKLSEHPNIIGMKDSGGDVAKFASIIFKTANNNFQMLAGSASFLYPALVVGAVGGVCALSNVLAKETCELFQLFQDGKHREATKLQHRLVAPNSAVTRSFGVPGLKSAMDLFGYYGGPPRSPLLSVKPSEAVAINQAFSGSGFDPPSEE
jgi:4-hydroxy-2-oxoglutarate aldolase